MKGFKTFIVNAIVMLLMLLQTLFPEAQLPTAEEVQVFATDAERVIDSATALWVSGLALLNMLLRGFTTTPIFKSEESANDTD